jgi:hypothetical protein
MKCSKYMFYLVFLDPDMIRPAYQNGALGLATLIGIWRGFLINCSICEVDGYLIHSRLGDVIREIGKEAELENNGLSDHITQMKKLFVQMEKLSRFVDLFSTSQADQSLVLLALHSSESIGVDLILTEQPLPNSPKHPEIAELSSYALSNFERERVKQLDDGLILEGSFCEEEFFSKCFGKLLPYAKRVSIVDGILGEKYGSNFEYTIERLVHYLELNNTSLSNFVLEIHTVDGEGRTDLLDQHLGKWCKKFRHKIHRHSCVGHERYLFTDQFGLQLGVGCDLLDKATRRNRGTDFSYSRLTKLQDLAKQLKWSS